MNKKNDSRDILFMGFFERNFSRTVSLNQIKQYIAHQKSNTSEKPLTEELIIIREIN